MSARSKQCGNKYKYASLDAAWAAARRRQQSLGPEHQLRAYQCKFCGAGHIGHKPAIMKSKRKHYERRGTVRWLMS